MTKAELEKQVADLKGDLLTITSERDSLRRQIEELGVNHQALAAQHEELKPVARRATRISNDALRLVVTMAAGQIPD